MYLAEDPAHPCPVPEKDQAHLHGNIKPSKGRENYPLPPVAHDPSPYSVPGPQPGP